MTPPRPEIVTRGVPAPGARPGSSARRAPTTRSVGLLYIATALTFLALAAIEFALMRVQLIVPENTLIEPEIFNRLLTVAAGDPGRPRSRSRWRSG